MKRVLFLSAGLLMLFGASEWAQTNQNQQTAQTGSIEGSVVRLGTTDIIPRAKISLRPANSQNVQTLTADDGGKFAFRGLAAGQYRVSAARDGYVTTEYGQRGPSGSGVAIELSAQQQIKDARIAMTPNGSIAGRILNRYGEPVGNANVQALRYTYQEGRRTLTPFQSIRSNDLGEYRLFWMPPGQYIVSVQAGDSLPMDPGGMVFFQRGGGGGVGGAVQFSAATRVAIAAVPPDFGGGPGLPPPPPPPPPPPAAGGPPNANDSAVFLPVYYPGTTDVTAASPVDLRAGGIVAGINLTVVEAKPVAVRGQVLNGGRPAAGAQVSIYQRNNSGGDMTIRGVPVNNDTGAFEFRNVAPGPYELVATMNGFGPGPIMINGGVIGGVATAAIGGRGGRTPGSPVMAAHAQVDVTDQDIERISLQLETGFNVSGRISLEGRAAGDDAGLSGVRIQLQPNPSIPMLAVPAVSVETDGTFAIAGITPGNFRLSVTGAPRNAYLKSARLGGLDILNGGIRIDSEPRGSLDVVLGNAPGAIDATIVDDRQLPVSAVTVALVPETQQKRYDLYRSATSDASGKVHWDGVVPGDYKIYAWEAVESGAWTDPDFMRTYQSSGVAVRVGEGGRSAADVRVIPYKVN